jgi:hypothetical protein
MLVYCLRDVESGNERGDGDPNCRKCHKASRTYTNKMQITLSVGPLEPGSQKEKVHRRPKPNAACAGSLTDGSKRPS